MKAIRQGTSPGVFEAGISLFTLATSASTVARCSFRGAEALSKSLEEQRDASLLYRKLATLRRDVPLAEDLQALRCKGPDDAELARLCQELGEPSLVDRLRAKAAA